MSFLTLPSWVRSYVGGSGGMPPQKILQKWKLLEWFWGNSESVFNIKNATNECFCENGLHYNYVQIDLIKLKHTWCCPQHKVYKIKFKNHQNLTFGRWEAAGLTLHCIQRENFNWTWNCQGLVLAVLQYDGQLTVAFKSLLLPKIKFITTQIKFVITHLGNDRPIF